MDECTPLPKVFVLALGLPFAVALIPAHTRVGESVKPDAFSLEEFTYDTKAVADAHNRSIIYLEV